MREVTEENARIGMKVRRGPKWDWSNQDCDDNGKQAVGIITVIGDPKGWVTVKWIGKHFTDGSQYFNSYRTTHPDLITEEDIQLEFDF